jgi:16S rRNA (guanine527-N7)-methyltransferase
MDTLARHVRDMLGIHLRPAQVTAFEKYEQALLDWNAKINLSAVRDPQDIRIKHFLDSLTCSLALREAPVERVIDVGTGAGFPGLPLKIVFPTMRLTLVESVGKKADFCRHVTSVLGLAGVEVIQGRAEVVGREAAHREQYDWALARAVAGMPVLAEYLLPLVRLGGRMLAMKGESGPAEAHAAEQALRLLGGQLRQLIPVHVPGVAEVRYLVVVEKVAATPAAYPRRAGLPAKRPLSVKG